MAEDQPLYDYENDIVTQQKAEELAALGFDSDVKAVMMTSAGRKFIARLLFTVCDLDGKQFTGNSRTYFNLGGREVGRCISDMVQDIAFEDYILMLRELRDGFKVKDEVKDV